MQLDTIHRSACCFIIATKYTPIDMHCIAIVSLNYCGIIHMMHCTSQQLIMEVSINFRNFQLALNVWKFLDSNSLMSTIDWNRKNWLKNRLLTTELKKCPRVLKFNEIGIFLSNFVFPCSSKIHCELERCEWDSKNEFITFQVDSKYHFRTFRTHS